MDGDRIGRRIEYSDRSDETSKRPIKSDERKAKEKEKNKKRKVKTDQKDERRQNRPVKKLNRVEECQSSTSYATFDEGQPSSPEKKGENDVISNEKRKQIEMPMDQSEEEDKAEIGKIRPKPVKRRRIEERTSSPKSHKRKKEEDYLRPKTFGNSKKKLYQRI